MVAAKSSSKSWFWKIRDICQKYHLPHPLTILNAQLSKEAFKKLYLPKVISFWEIQLRGEAALLSSLNFFKPEYMSLTKPHPLWATVGCNPYEVCKAIQQSRFLSGRYRSEELAGHWSSNKEGYCLAPTCHKKVENTKHILIECEAYFQCKTRLYALWVSYPCSVVHRLVLEALSAETDYLLQFILDCSVLPSVIHAVQSFGQIVLKKLFYLTRSWCWSVHKQRMKLLGRWDYN